MTFSLSGIENKVRQYRDSGAEDGATAAFTLQCIVHAVKVATEQALSRYGDLPVIFTGGVSSNSLLRAEMEPLGGIFGAPAYSTDNAMGIAVLTYFMEKQHG